MSTKATTKKHTHRPAKRKAARKPQLPTRRTREAAYGITDYLLDSAAVVGAYAYDVGSVLGHYASAAAYGAAFGTGANIAGRGVNWAATRVGRG